MADYKTIHANGNRFSLPAGCGETQSAYTTLARAITGVEIPSQLQGVRGDLDLAEKLLQKGPAAGTLADSREGFARVASFYADHSDKPLELVLDSHKARCMGISLSKGSIIVRGSVIEATGEGMTGGSLYVDGDAREVKGIQGGLLGIKGDVQSLKDLYAGVVLIAGNVRQSVPGEQIAADEPNLPTPFCFTREPINLYGQAGDAHSPPAIRSNRLLARLADNLTAENLYPIAVHCCRRKLAADLRKRLDKLHNVKSLDDAWRFHEEEIAGFSFGRIVGYITGMSVGHVIAALDESLSLVETRKGAQKRKTE